MTHWQEKFDLKNPQSPAIMFSSIEYGVVIRTGFFGFLGREGAGYWQKF